MCFPTLPHFVEAFPGRLICPGPKLLSASPAFQIVGGAQDRGDRSILVQESPSLLLCPYGAHSLFSIFGIRLDSMPAYTLSTFYLICVLSHLSRILVGLGWMPSPTYLNGISAPRANPAKSRLSSYPKLYCFGCQSNCLSYTCPPLGPKRKAVRSASVWDPSKRTFVTCIGQLGPNQLLSAEASALGPNLLIRLPTRFTLY
jgi:hypothetical protein